MNDLTALTSLRLYENALTGSIPREIGKLESLTFLAIGSSEMTGTLPGEIAELKKLTSLRIYDTKLRGSIPDKLSDMSNLEYLSLAGNSLTGSIPKDLFRSLTGLKGLALSDNVSSGRTQSFLPPNKPCLINDNNKFVSPPTGFNRNSDSAIRGA